LLESICMSNQGTTKFFTKDTVQRKWVLIDAKDKTLGRLATEIAAILRGKNKAEFTPNQDCGDFVVVVNCAEIKVTGKKPKQKLYQRHSGTPGGFKEETLESLLKRRPLEVLRRAVKGMLPHNRLSDRLITKLKLYAGAEHEQQAQLK
jgi:large subunit ribosomal protein L13